MFAIDLIFKQYRAMWLFLCAPKLLHDLKANRKQKPDRRYCCQCLNLRLFGRNQVNFIVEELPL